MSKLKKIAKIVGLTLGVVLVGSGVFIGWQVAAFDASMAKVYDVPPLAIQARTDPAALARGKHLAESLGGCALNDCHGTDLGGGRQMDVGPLGTFAAPNVTLITSAYTDGELARLLRYGLRKDGRSVRFMPSQDFAWWRDDDIAALIGYLRQVPRVERPNGTMRIGLLAKILDRRGLFKMDVARHLVGKPLEQAPPPAPTKEYGAYLARLCHGCHGDGLGGGKIPGAPPSLPIPPNLTPDPSGLGPDYSYDQFVRLMVEGVKKNGQKLNPFMPIEAIARMDEVEKHALFAHLRALPARPFGSR
jgi:hypothetical protein